VEVETVAWITEHKNTLSGACYLGAALAYLNYDRDRKWTFYAGALGLFVLGLMAKSVIVTLPAALLVVFWWKRGRLAWKKDVLPLLPFFAVGIASGLFTAWMERKFVGAEGSEFDFSLVERCLIAGHAFWFYLGKLFWPATLVFIYPRWNVNQAVWWQYLFPAAALLLLAGFWLLRRRARGPLAGLLFFAGTLFPALGFFNVYPFRYSFVADHFQYLASIGPIILAAAGMTMASGFLVGRKPFLKPVLCGVLLAVLGMLTWRQCGMYADNETLWRTTLARNPNSFMVHDNLGAALLKKGQVVAAIEQFQTALELEPENASARNNLGAAFLEQGRVDEAIEEYQKAIAVEPENLIAQHMAQRMLGNLLLRKGQVDQAISHYLKALEINPANAEVHNNLGLALFQKGRMDEAIAQCQKALEINPHFAEAHFTFGNALFQKGQLDQAIAHYQQALAISPNFTGVHYNLGNALLQKGQVDEAVVQYQKVLEVHPDSAEVYDKLRQLAWMLATSPDASVRNGVKAVELAQQANQLGGKNPVFLHTLAAACAEAGRFGDAIQNVQKAIELARAAGQPDLVEQLNGELKLYEAGLPFHQKSK
jgi:tetratricopeptide (TPR) repeat protein